MKKIAVYSSIVFLLLACHSSTTSDKIIESPSQDSVAAVRFLNNIVKGNFQEAMQQIYLDSMNKQYLSAFEGWYNTKLSASEKQKFNNAKITIDSIAHISDSVHIVCYTNLNENKNYKLKMLKQNNNWLIDFKFLFPPKK